MKKEGMELTNEIYKKRASFIICVIS